MNFILGIVFCLLSFNRTPIVIKEASIRDKTWKSTQDLIALLLDYPIGKNLLEFAYSKKDKNPLYIISSNQSYTDTKIERIISKRNCDIRNYKYKTTIFINKNLPLVDAVLDLAHELTHYAYKEKYNPYETHYSLKQFIRYTIEEQGGEIHAYKNECQLQKEMGVKRSGNYQCNLMEKKDKEMFYSMGEHFNQLKDLENEFPFLSDKNYQFISSVYDVPYPLAAKYEYKKMMKTVCQNELKRWKISLYDKNCQNKRGDICNKDLIN